MRRASRWNTLRDRLQSLGRKALAVFGVGDLKLPPHDWTEDAPLPRRALTDEQARAARFLILMGVPKEEAVMRAPCFLALADEGECRCLTCRRAAMALNN